MKKTLDIFKNKYDCIFSIGTACFTAEMLTKAQLRVFSSPFDWLSGGGIEDRMKFLCNNFENFININDLEKIGEREYPENCYIYCNNLNGIVFHHDFPKDETLENSYPKVRDKYDRRIKKLNDKLQNSPRSLIIYMDIYENPIKKEKIASLIQEINEKFNKTTIDILFVNHNSKMPDKESTIEQISPNAYYAELYNKQRDSDDLGNYKNCKRILSKIKLRKTLKEMLLKISKGRKRVRVYFFGVKIMSFKVNE